MKMKGKRARRYLKHIVICVKDFFMKPSADELKRRKQQADYDYLRKYGVETELGYVTLNGLPHIEIAPGGRIIIGKNVFLDSKINAAGNCRPVILSCFLNNAVIEIADGVGASGASIAAGKSIKIGEQTMLGTNCNIWDLDFHPIEAISRLKGNPSTPIPVSIGKRCWIGANSTVCKGVTLGDEAVVGTMSLVTKDVPAKTVVGGVPAKVIKLI